MIGKKIKQLRLQKGLSLTELAERAGVSKSYLSTIERDLQKNPSIQFLEKIADVLGVSVFQIMGTSEHAAKALDQGWIDLIKEAMDSGIDKQSFKEFLDYQKWRRGKV
ncbi:helix-turn-helix domain-containing protein [Camelliibacillus cellulosilyticus]|uniref:Helix-turn-helix domain-containing protein n=1 Tax=Camelliibacillus cellulosilyticus TaxID=2174486 RepID=A0ABV9GHK1_9BACL